MVGGTVRDMLAGCRSSDIDLVVRNDIARTARQIAAKTGGRIVDIAKKGFALLRVASPDTIVDITPLNGASIEADLLQRDFTINAIACHIRSGRLVDCTGGLADIRHATVRMVAPSALEKDPARLVRAYRLAATLKFNVDADTEAAIGQRRHLVDTVAGERIWAELLKLFQVARSAPIVNRMASSGLLTAILPELLPAVGCSQNQFHAFDVFEHSLQAYGHLEDLLTTFEDRFAHLPTVAASKDLQANAAMLKYACLLHDVGKPATRNVDDTGHVHFYGHAAKSADIATAISRRLRLSKKQREIADAVIRHHIRPLFLFIASQKNSLDRRGMVRFFRRVGDLTVPIVVHTMADIMAKGPALEGRDRQFIDFCDDLLSAYDATCRQRQTVPPPIDGNDLLTVFSLSPSPLIGRLLKQVDELRLSGELASRDQALAWVAAYLKSEAGGWRTDDSRQRTERREPMVDA